MTDSAGSRSNRGRLNVDDMPAATEQWDEGRGFFPAPCSGADILVGVRNEATLRVDLHRGPPW